jgi:hypothetical protein
MTVPVTTTATGVASKTQDSTPTNTKSPRIFQRARQVTGHAHKAFGKVQSIWGLSSKKSTSSRSKTPKMPAFSKWNRPKIPLVVTFAPSIASVHKVNTDSRSSPDDTVTFTPVGDLDARLSPSGVQASPGDETPPDVLTSHDDDGTPSDTQTSHDDTAASASERPILS